MARLSLVIDASIAVKWFSALDEANVTQAVDILDRRAKGEITLLVPDLLYYEVSNALVHKKALSNEKVQLSIAGLFTLGMQTIYTDADLMAMSARLARQFGITVYDACYAALAQKYGCPLVTANPRHQVQTLGCQVIPIEEWKQSL